MNNWAADKSVCLLLVAILFSSSTILFGGPEPLATDGKDYSKEVVPVKKSWCETPPPWEIRIGAPGWLAGLSGESGVQECSRLLRRYLQPAFQPSDACAHCAQR